MQCVSHLDLFNQRLVAYYQGDLVIVGGIIDQRIYSMNSILLIPLQVNLNSSTEFGAFSVQGVRGFNTSNGYGTAFALRFEIEGDVWASWYEEIPGERKVWI
jgi:hypothetical protein